MASRQVSRLPKLRASSLAVAWPILGHARDTPLDGVPRILGLVALPLGCGVLGLKLAEWRARVPLEPVRSP